MGLRIVSRRTVRLATAIVGIVLVSVQLTAGAQRAPSAQRPDLLSGSYERYRGVPGARGATPRPDATVPPPPSQPPLKTEYLKEWQTQQQAAREADEKGEPLAASVVKCLPEGMPAMMNGPFPMEILESKGQVTIIQEAYNQVRRILLDQPQKPIDDIEPGFYGHSVGRWEGDTLLVDTIGIKESVRYQNMPHSKDMRIKERIRSVAPDIVWDEITIEDPATLLKSWTYTVAYKRMPGYTLLEYICEDNREYEDEQGIQKIRLRPDR
jgi:hypothetical protein